MSLIDSLRCTIERCTCTAPEEAWPCKNSRLITAPPGAFLEKAYPDPDCGCPVEEWVYGGISLILHFEADGTMEAHADTGDWEMDVPLKASTMEAARAEVFAWVDTLPVDPRA